MGYTNTEIAECLGVHRDTLQTWLAEKTDFSDAMAYARAPTDVTVTQGLLTSAVGGLVEEEQAIKIKLANGGEDVKVVKVKRYIPPNPQAGMYWLNNRQRDHWKNYKAHEHGGPGGGPIKHEIVTSESLLAAIKDITEALK